MKFREGTCTAPLGGLLGLLGGPGLGDHGIQDVEVGHQELQQGGSRIGGLAGVFEDRLGTPTPIGVLGNVGLQVSTAIAAGQARAPHTRGYRGGTKTRRNTGTECPADIFSLGRRTSLTWVVSTCSTARLASGLERRPLVCPSNCGSVIERRGAAHQCLLGRNAALAAPERAIGGRRPEIWDGRKAGIGLS